MSSQKDLILYDASGAEYFYENTKPSITETFTQYKVVKGKWILYKKPNFNGASATNKDIVELLEGPTLQNKLPFSPRSIRRLRDSSDSVEVFEHAYYGGHCKGFLEACEDVTPSFPAIDPQGASSIIVWPNKSWELYKETLYKGGEHTLAPGKYPTPAAMGFTNDSLKSLRPA